MELKEKDQGAVRSRRLDFLISRDRSERIGEMRTDMSLYETFLLEVGGQ